LRPLLRELEAPAHNFARAPFVSAAHTSIAAADSEAGHVVRLWMPILASWAIILKKGKTSIYFYFHHAVERAAGRSEGLLKFSSESRGRRAQAPPLFHRTSREFILKR
jgi:hypothetical protein